MKRTSLLLMAATLCLGAAAQTSVRKTKPTGFTDTRAERNLLINAEEPSVAPKLNIPANTQAPVSQEKQSSITTTTINWQLLTGSMNTYGMLVSQSRPLQYNDNVNAVTFIHRKSATYTANPIGDSNPGTIVAEVTANWGANWDSTCIYADFEAGRYPQGAIYAGLGNSNIANAYVVGCGPTVSNNLFTGDWYASKKLGAPGSGFYNSAPDVTPGGQQFLSFSLGTYPATQMQHGWSRYGFSATDDGIVRSLALIEDDLQGLSTMRGVMVVKGTYNAGVFVWTTDSLVPNCVLANDGSKQLSSQVQMAWNESGTIGYVVLLGGLQTATLSNRGFQPIIYKSSNSGSSWAQVTGIDFNDPSKAPILNTLFSTQTDPNLVIPIVDDYDITVDKNGKLHIAAILASTWDLGDDDIGSTSLVAPSINPTENYKWLHAPGSRPYLYDFIGDGTGAWQYVLVDSLSSEGPSPSPAGAGYNDNPWDPTGTGSAKLSVDSRIQLGRTPDGNFLTFSFTESDTNFTSSGRKWNNMPNIKTRLMAVKNGTPITYPIAINEHNVTQYPASVGVQHPEVSTRATLHYMSPTTSTAAVTSCSIAELKTPFTITNSNPWSQLTNNTTWYTTATLSYTFSTCVDIITGAFVESGINAGSELVLFPNPAKDQVVLSLNAKGDAEIKAYSLVGQEVRSWYPAASTNNEVKLELNGLSPGIYLIKVKQAGMISTKKLVIE